MARWTFDKLVLVAANLLAIFASLVHAGWTIGPDLLQQTFPLLAVGLVATIVLLFYEPAWLYLVAGLASAVYPVLVLGVFAGPTILTMSGKGEYPAALAL